MLFFDYFDRIIRIVKNKAKTFAPILKIVLILSKNRLCGSLGKNMEVEVRKSGDTQKNEKILKKLTLIFMYVNVYVVVGRYRKYQI